jgi:hypothetical protein
MQICCPSGLKFIARRWRIGDQAALLDVKEHQGSSLPKKMLALAAQEVIEPGPYNFHDKLDTNVLTVADITVGNILIRAGTRRELYLRPTCNVCRRILREPIEYDLNDVGPFYMASMEGVEHIRTGTPVVRKYDNVTVKLRAVRGSDLVEIGKLQEDDPVHMFEHQLVSYIDEIHGPGILEAVPRMNPMGGPGLDPNAPLRNKLHILEYVRSLPWEIRDQIDEDTEELFGGVDTTLSFKCDHPDCLGANEIQVPLDPSFYGLDASSRRLRRRKTSMATRSASELMRSSSSPSSSDSPNSPTSSLED